MKITEDFFKNRLWFDDNKIATVIFDEDFNSLEEQFKNLLDFIDEAKNKFEYVIVLTYQPIESQNVRVLDSIKGVHYVYCAREDEELDVVKQQFFKHGVHHVM